MAIRVAIVTLSDKASAGVRADASGPGIASALSAAGVEHDVVATQVLPDDAAGISRVLTELTDRSDVDLVLTTGGTGLAPRDVTPQATQAVLDYEVPGIAEAMRAASLRITPGAMLSRAVAGVRGQTLIINLPGSPKAVAELIPVVAPVLRHAVETLRVPIGDHDAPKS
jgi:molybdenum cofactor synthesis domain-containing protein